MCRQIKRVKTKGRGPRRPSQPHDEPNFYEPLTNAATLEASTRSPSTPQIALRRDRCLFAFGPQLPLATISRRPIDLASSVLMSMSPHAVDPYSQTGVQSILCPQANADIRLPLVPGSHAQGQASTSLTVRGLQSGMQGLILDSEESPIQRLPSTLTFQERFALADYRSYSDASIADLIMFQSKFSHGAGLP